MGRQITRHPKIYKGADDLWHCWLTVGVNAAGKLDRRHIKSRTHDGVGEILDRLLAQLDKGSGAPAKVESVEQWLRHWLEHVVKPRRAYKTVQAYRPIIELHIIPAIGTRRLSGNRARLEPEHLDRMYADLGKKLAPSYVLQVHRVLRKSLQDAVKRGRAARNVCDLVDPPSARRVHVKAYSLTDAQAIIRAAAEDPMSARWLISILLGLRQGEVLNLRWSNLHLEDQHPSMSVSKQLQRHTWEHGCRAPHACAARHCRTKPCPPAGCKRHKVKCPPPCPADCISHARACPERTGGGLVEVDVKSERGERTLGLSPVIVNALVSWREQQQRDRARLGASWDPAGFVFTSAAGSPLDPRRDHERWEQLLARAGVADGRLHAARHTAGTLMVATGTDISVVQEMLGHADIRVTRQYVDVAKELKREAVDRVAAALFDGQLAALLQPSSANSPRQS